MEISIEERLPYRISKKAVDNAKRHGIMFEFRLSSAFRSKIWRQLNNRKDAFNRKNLFTIVSMLNFYCRGKNIILGW